METYTKVLLKSKQSLNDIIQYQSVLKAKQTGSVMLTDTLRQGSFMFYIMV